MTVILLVFGLILFVCLVVVHEYGHFIAARKTGVEVEEFGIGFPPRAWGKKLSSGLLLSINWLPLGGFVKLKGENDADKRPGSFGAARLKHKIIIMVAGVLMNLAAALILFTITAWAGMPKLLENQFNVASDTKIVRQDVLIADVEKGSPASTAGLKQRDIILTMGAEGGPQQVVTSADSLPQLTSRYAGQTVELHFKRSGKAQQTLVTLRSSNEVEASKKTDDPKGYLGIIPTEYILQRSTWSAPIVAVGLAGQITSENFKGLGKALSNVFRGNGAAASEQVSGPIGVARLIFDGSLLGVQAVLFIMAAISLVLAVMNALPIPALDGGRLFVTLLFRIINKPLKKETEELIHGTGFMALIALVVLISVIDVRRLF